MDNLTKAVAIISAFEVILSLVVIPLFVFVLNVANGVKCQLRSEILRVYYRHKDNDSLRQYEVENLVFLYKAYKTLKGNSFIDKIYKEMMTWEVIT